jgi:HSP20 family protein
MATQNDQKSLPGQPNEQQRSLQRNSPESSPSSGRRASALGFGMTPQEFFSTNPFSVMRRMTEEMSRVMEELGLAQADGGRTTWAPAIEIAERDGALNVRAELPGLSPDDVSVDIAKDALVIRGERKVEREEKDRGVQRTERQYGFFYRTIPLPEGADVEHARAKFRDGMLEVTIPVPQQQEQRRSVPIESESRSQTGAQTRAA